MSRCWIWIARSGRVAAAVIAHRSLFRRVDLPGVPAPARLRPILPARRRAAGRCPASRYQTVIVPRFPPAPLSSQLTCPCSAVGRFRPDFRLSHPPGQAGPRWSRPPWRPAGRALPGRGGPDQYGECAGRVRPACGLAGRPSRPLLSGAVLAHAIGGVISAAVVLAAFWAAIRLLAGRAFRRAAYPRRLLAPHRRGAVAVPLARAAWRVVLVAARFASGAPLGRRRTDATFLSPGTHPVSALPGWYTTAQPSRWAYLPGWQRAAIRWAAVAIAIGLYARPVETGIVLGAAAGTGVAVVACRWPAWRHARTVVRPVYLQLCGYLGTDPADRPGRYLHVPHRFAADPDAMVALTYPAEWNPDAAKQKAIDEVIRRHLGGDLAGSFGPHTATWRHPPAPPERALFDGYQLPAHRIHLATLAGGRKWIADLEHEEPHLFIAAGTGGGKTATASVAAAHARAHGWLIDIIDPKRRSYIDRKTGADVLVNVPGIRLHTTIEAMLWAMEEFFLSMLGINIAVGDRTAWPGAFPQRMLVIDEFGTFAGMAARTHQRAGGTGPPPALDQRRQIEWQGRQAGHRLLVAVHQPNLRLFADSDSRSSYGYRLITGSYTASLWRMTFGYAPPIEWDARIKGRGAVGIGEAPSLIHHAQIAWMPAAERRRYALTGPPPPDWHAYGRPAPWITPRVLAEGRKLAGASLVTVPAAPALVPPGQQLSLPAETLSGVPPWDTPVGQSADSADQVTDSGDGLITGIADAARYLGYDQADSFRRARTRHPIPGETRTSDGRPAWTPATLRTWHAQRKVASNRPAASEPD